MNLKNKKLSFLIVTVGRALLGQATYPFAWIPICFFSHSHQCIIEKAKVPCHYRPTLPLGQAGYLLLKFFLFCFLNDCMFPKPYRSFCAACLCLRGCLPALPACLPSLARIRCRLAGLPCHLPWLRDDQFAATLCVRRATPCSCLTIRERGRERVGQGREKQREREREREREMAG